MCRLVIKDEVTVALVDLKTGKIKTTFKAKPFFPPQEEKEIEGQLSIEGMIEEK